MVPEGWELVQAEEVCERISVGIVVKPADYYVPEGQGTRAFRSANVREGKVEDQNWVYLSAEGNRINKKSVLKSGDILIVRTGYPGTACIVPREFEGSNCIDVIFARPSRSRITSEYLCAFTNSEHGRRQVLDGQGGLAQKHFNVGAYKKLNLPLPPLPEQKKIADILSTWDKAIETTEKLLANAEKQKRALMKLLLTGKKRLARFKGTPWAEACIASIAKEVSERNRHGHDWPVVSCSKTLGFVNSMEYFKKQVFSDERSGYKVIRRGQIGYPSNHIEEGSIGLQNLHDVAVVSPIYTVFETSPIMDSQFIFHVLKTDRYRQIFAAATNSSVDRRGSLRWKAFSAIMVPVPSLDEQRAINEVLIGAANEVHGFSEQLAALRSEKVALMQQLLTGKRRVTV